MNALEWDRPLAALLLLVPLAVWLVARRRADAAVRESGASELWRRSASEVPLAARRGGARTPRWLAAALVGLGASALALAGPRLAEARARAELHVHVARDPAWAVDADRTGSRVERACAAVRALAAALDPAPARLVWHATDRAPLATAFDGAPPVAWIAAGPFPGAPLAARDAPDAMWVLPRAPSSLPASAGVVAAGGPAVEGAVAWDAGGRYEAQDGPLVRVPWAGAPPRVAIADAPPWDGPLGDAARAWAAARGIAVEGEGEVVLECVAGGAAGSSAGARAGRDGWSVAVEVLSGSASGAAADGAPQGDAWLAAGGTTLVAWSAGRVEAAAARWAEPEGDGALFALSVAELLDGAVRAPEGVFPASARAAMGAPLVQPPRWEPARARAASSPWRRTWPVALAAALAALAFGAAAALRRAGA